MNPNDKPQSEIHRMPRNTSWKFEEFTKREKKLIAIHRANISYTVRQELSIPRNWYDSRGDGEYICGLPNLTTDYKLRVEQSDTGDPIAYGRVSLSLHRNGSINANLCISLLEKVKGVAYDLFEWCIKVERAQHFLKADDFKAEVGGELSLPEECIIRVNNTHNLIDIAQIGARSIDDALREIRHSIDTLYSGTASADIFSPIDDALFQNQRTEPYLSWEQLVKRELGIGKPKTMD